MIKFKVGDKVRVVDNGELDTLQSQLIGKKGTITEMAIVPYVKFKGKDLAISFMPDKLTIAKPKRIPFDLERALKGDEVVTREGRKVTEIRFVNSENYPICAEIDHTVRHFTNRGRWDDDIKKSDYDLFMKHPAKAKTDTEVLTEMFKDATFTVEPVKDYELLKSRFIELTQALSYEMIGKPGHDSRFREMIVQNWKESAGL